MCLRLPAMGAEDMCMYICRCLSLPPAPIIGSVIYLQPQHPHTLNIPQKIDLYDTRTARAITITRAEKANKSRQFQTTWTHLKHEKRCLIFLCLLKYVWGLNLLFETCSSWIVYENTYCVHNVHNSTVVGRGGGVIYGVCCIISSFSAIFIFKMVFK